MQIAIATKINSNVYKKDPLSSDLGYRIIQNGIDLMEELGFEDFTFKKLASKINSTEASIYRYFENKHNFLGYIMMWYWNWQEQRIELATINIEDPKVQLRKAITCITEKITEDKKVAFVNESKLNRIVIAEATKLYCSKSVESDNELGFFIAYKSLVQKIADIVIDINADFKYPHMLISTVIEGAHHQRFFADFLPRLTDVVKGEDAITSFYIQLVERELGIEQ